MGTSNNVEQVHPDSIDSLGISVATSAQRADDQRYGSAYVGSTFAGAALVAAHPLGSRTLLFFSRRWHSATAAGAVPGYYSSHTEVVEPGWAILDPRSGALTAVDGSFAIPRTTAGTVVLQSVTARSDLIWVLSILDDDKGLIQTFHKTPGGGVLLQNEEVIAGPPGVAYGRGLYLEAPYMFVFGTDEAGGVHLARKPWAKVGDTTTSWEWQTSRGWTADPQDVNIQALQTDEGVLFSDGPISTVSYRGRRFISTVDDNSGVLSAVLWASRGLSDVWARQGNPVSLGNSSTYLGGTLYFHDQLEVKTGLPLLEDGAFSSAFLASKTVRGAVSSNNALLTSWQLIPVSRVGLTAIAQGS